MKKKDLPVIINATTYFDNLLEELNHYEGSSLHFSEINHTFVDYLKRKFINIEHVEYEILDNLKSKIDFMNHPFLPSMVEILEGKHLFKSEWETLLSALAHHPNYPLTHFFSLVHKNSSKQPLSGKVKLNELINGNGLLFNYLGYHGLKGITERDKMHILMAYRTAGFTYATTILVRLALDNEDVNAINVNDIKDQIILTARQAHKEESTYVGETLLYFGLYYPNVKPIAADFFKLALEHNCDDALMPLVRYYEEAKELGEDRFAYAFYYLCIAHFKKIAGAREKIISYYRNGIYIPKNEQIAKEISDHL